MPEIKLKHVVSFSSEDKVHKAENLLKPESYRKWKCAAPGEKNATIVLQFEKATQIQSIDIGNEGSAFVEVLVGRSSDSVNDFQVLLVASSFMSPLESRNETHTNRVRMFGPEKLSQLVKDQKWDCVQIVCTQPFNKNITYGLSFIKFHSVEKVKEETESESAAIKIGAFTLKDEDDEDSLPSVSAWLGKKKMPDSRDSSSNIANKDELSYAAAVLASSSNTFKGSPQKRKTDDIKKESHEPPVKKSPRNILNKDYITYKNVLDLKPESKKSDEASPSSLRNVIQKKPDKEKIPKANDNKPRTSEKHGKVKKKIPFHKTMGKVVFVLSGFVNPLRSELRDKAVEMGAKYKGDWDNSCTHLICAFLNTPKYGKVRKEDGRIVTKEWILDCYKKKTLLPWRDYMLGKYSKASSDECDSTDEEYEDTRDKKKDKLSNGEQAKKGTLSTPRRQGHITSDEEMDTSERGSQSLVQNNATKDDSETEDEDAIQDYVADTDVDSDSDGDTEDEIRKVESKINRKAEISPAKNKKCASEEESLLSKKPDVSDLPLPELPNLFKQKHFYLYGDFSASKYHDLQRYITAYNGVIDDYMGDSTKYVITEKKWDKNFDDAACENEDLIFIKPMWIYKCHEARKSVPYQPHIVIPDS